MKRVAIIGSPGTGKSTFARKFADKTGLPLIHLDFYYHDKTKNYYEDKEAWAAITTELAGSDCWIIDGNASRTIAERLKQADTIMYFDLPRYVAVWGIVKRWCKAPFTKRHDMPSDWKEKLSVQFLRYVWGFRNKYNSDTRGLLARDTGKQIMIFTSHKQADEYLQNLPHTK